MFTETDNVNLTERDELRRLEIATIVMSPLSERAASYMADAMKMIGTSLEPEVRLYARIAFRLARRSIGEKD